LYKTGSGCQSQIGNLAKVVACAENSQSRVAEIISKVPREQSDQKFAQHRRLLEPGHDAPANRGAEREENQGEQNRDDRVTAWRRENEKSGHQRFFAAGVHG